MEPLLTVALLGLSAEGLAICPFFAFGMGLSDRRTGVLFLSGRIVGLLCFGIVITIIGKSLLIQDRFVNIIFGASVIALGMHRMVKANRFHGFGTKNGAMTQRGHGGCGRHGHGINKIGFGLGLFRGFLIPGKKYIFLAPLLISAGLVKGLALSFTFGVTSSFYLILGFASAGIMQKLVPHKRAIGSLGAILLIVIGLVYGFRGIGAFLITNRQ